MDKDAEKRSMCGVRRTERNDDDACELGHLPTDSLAWSAFTGSRLSQSNIERVSGMAVPTSPSLHFNTVSYRFAEQVLSSPTATEVCFPVHTSTSYRHAPIHHSPICNFCFWVGC